jgi:hypothetical protein
MRATIALLMFSLPCLALAAAPVGRVIETSGTVNAGATAVRAGAELTAGTHLSSGKGAEATLRMADDAMILMAESSDLLVDDYVFDAHNTSTAQARYVFNQGVIRLISGAMSKLKPESVTLNTSYGDVTTLGTDYTAGLCAAGCADTPGLYLSVRSGQIRFANAKGVTIIRAGQVVRIDGHNSPPVFLSKPPAITLALGTNVLVAEFDSTDPETLRLRTDALDFLDGIIDPPASPSRPVASAAR